MKKVIAVLVGVLAMTAAAVGIANAEPGPNGLNDHGLCTAYFNGQKNGHGEGEDQTNQPPPFQGLEDAAEEYTDNDGETDPSGADNDRDRQVDEEDGSESEALTDAENIFNYCNDLSTIGGNPEHGRFTCVDEGGTDVDGSDSDSDPECNENDEPGNS